LLQISAHIHLKSFLGSGGKGEGGSFERARLSWSASPLLRSAGGGGRDCGHTPPVAVLPRTLQSPQMTANIATCIIHSIGAMPARTVWANFATVCMRFFSLNALPAVFFGISRNMPSHYFAVYSSSSSFFVPEPRLI